MADSGVDRTLAIRITPKLDVDALTKQIRDAVAAALKDGTLKLPVETQTSTKPRPEGEKEGHGPTQSSGTRAAENPTGTKTQEQLAQEKAEAQRKRVQQIQSVGKIAKVGFDVSQQIFKGIFGIIKEIHSRVKQASAFLATVENLFNVAMTLLLMPLGNALAETILPATMGLVEKVTDLWDVMDQTYKKDGLKGIISVVMREGIRLFGQQFDELGSIFTGTEDTLLGSIGSLFKWVGNILENGRFASLLDSLFRIFKVFADHIDIWIPTMIGLQTAQYGAILGAASAGIFGLVPGVAGITGAAGAGLAGLGGFAVSSYYLNTAPSNASGGFYPATSGGHVIRVAERGENEYVIPESKMGNMGGNVTINVQFNGLTYPEAEDRFREVLRDEVKSISYRSGF